MKMTCCGVTRSGKQCRNLVTQAGTNCGRCKGDAPTHRFEFRDATGDEVEAALGAYVNEVRANKSAMCVTAAFDSGEGWEVRYEVQECFPDGVVPDAEDFDIDVVESELRERLVGDVEKYRQAISGAVGRDVAFDGGCNVVADGETIARLAPSGSKWVFEGGLEASMIDSPEGVAEQFAEAVGGRR